MTIEQDIALLEQVPTFRVLGREALRILAIGTETRSVQEGEVLFRAGEPADGAFLVETGSFRLGNPASRTRPAVVRRGALLGELALITQARRHSTATALELSSVMRISRPLFLKMLDGYPEVAERLRATLLERTQDLVHDLGVARAAFARGSAEEGKKPSRASE